MTIPNLDPFTEAHIGPFDPLLSFLYNVFYLSFFLFSVLLMTIVDTLCPNKETFSKIVKFYVRNIYYFVMPYKHINYKGVPQEPTIIVGNHSCLIDFLLMNILPFDVEQMISSGVFKRLWFMRRILKGLGGIVVEYGKREETLQKAIHFMKEGQRHIFIFPEGDINSTENPTLKFRTGAFEIARRTGYKIQPVIFKNSRKFAPYSRGERTFFNPFTLPIEVKWLESYSISDEANVEEEAEKLQAVYEEALRI